MLFSARATALFFCLFVAVAGTTAQTTKPAPKVRRPNVILITVDTVRADHIGAYGYKGIKTPNIDSLATDGVRLDRKSVV